MKKLMFKLKNRKIFRWYKGGVWVNLEFRGWIQCTWNTTSEKGYLLSKGWGYLNNNNAMFHKNFNGIIEIEDYSYRNKKVDLSIK
jgi:hypothetical protein